MHTKLPLGCLAIYLFPFVNKDEYTSVTCETIRMIRKEKNTNFAVKQKFVCREGKQSNRGGGDVDNAGSSSTSNERERAKLAGTSKITMCMGGGVDKKFA